MKSHYSSINHHYKKEKKKKKSAGKIKNDKYFSKHPDIAVKVPYH